MCAAGTCIEFQSLIIGCMQHKYLDRTRPITSHSVYNLNVCVNLISRLHIIRPYKSLKQIGEIAFKEQCYFVTHLILALTSWGRYKLPKQSMIPEFIFLLQNLNVVIKLGDPELAGEFLQSLRLLGVSNESYPIQRGISYLLNKEKSLKGKGMWVCPKLQNKLA